MGIDSIEYENLFASLDSNMSVEQIKEHTKLILHSSSEEGDDEILQYKLDELREWTPNDFDTMTASNIRRAIDELRDENNKEHSIKVASKLKSKQN